MNGNWGAWSVFGACSVTCGGGTQTHTRLCNNPAPANGGAACSGLANENAACNLQACPTGKYYAINEKLFSLFCNFTYLNAL